MRLISLLMLLGMMMALVFGTGQRAYAGVGDSCATQNECGCFGATKAICLTIWRDCSDPIYAGFCSANCSPDLECTIALPTVTTATVDAYTSTTATLGGNITDIGIGNATERGVCWNTSGNPTITDSNNGETGNFGTGSFTSEITELLPSTTYYVKAYAVNSTGTAYGNQESFTTSELVGDVPVVETLSVSNITSDSASSGGDVTSDGGSQITERGVCWSDSSPPTIDDEQSVGNSPDTGEFTSNITGLISNIKYYVRAYATNSQGTAYGEVKSFTTDGADPTTPSVTTADISLVTSTGAKSGGNVTSDGGSSVTERGVCWSDSSPPTIGDEKSVGNSPDTGEFTSNITGLISNIKYYVRAYATNSQGTAYGEVKSFTTDGADPTTPSVTTADISLVTSTGAKSGGEVTSNGNLTITERGVCWSESAPPTIGDTTLKDASSALGTFTSILTGLNPGTKYYLRAYATNSQGTGYGEEKHFTTAITSEIPSVETVQVSGITLDGAIVDGEVMSDGGATITGRGVCWSETSPPTIDDDKSADNSPGIGAFTSLITGLDPLTTYHLRAYATNVEGTGYGAEIIFITRDVPIPPTVTTDEVHLADATCGNPISASCGGNITSDGGSAIMEKGVCWSETSPATIDDHQNGDFFSATGPFTTDMDNLNPYIRYYVRAYAINSAGVAYGKERKFTTPDGCAVPPKITTAEVTGITSRGATSGGIVESNGGGSITERGVCWSEASSPPTIDHNKLTDTTSGLGPFTIVITGLKPDTKYYLRAYATNSGGTAYGSEQIFITLPDPEIPEMTTAEVNAVTLNSAMAGGEVTSDGGADITERGVCWSEASHPTIDDEKLPDNASGLGTFVSAITGLAPDTEYHLRAYATNSEGTAYGENKTFRTKTEPTPPSIVTAQVSAITRTGATCGGEIISDGGSGIIKRGVCWSETSPPTISDTILPDNSFGSGTFTSIITGLNPDTKYCIRAYARNGIGLSYGKEKDFTTKSHPVPPEVETSEVTAVTRTGATCGGEVFSDGGSGLIEQGVCWSEMPGPTVLDDKLKDNSSGISVFKSVVTGLKPDTRYYIKAYATNEVGTSYGSEKNFKTPIMPIPPTVTTAEITSLTSDGVTCGGTVTSDGGSSVTERGVCWSKTSPPTVDDEKFMDASSGIGPFVSTITGLEPDTTYYISAYAKNEAGVAYGTERIFTTPFIPIPPTVETTEASDVTSESAVIGGNVTSDGGSSVIERGVCWGETPSPTIDDNKLVDTSSGIGAFQIIITGLTPETTYYVRAYATHSVGTGYGLEKNFATMPNEPGIPTVTTAEVSFITYGGVTSGGDVVSENGSPVTERGVCWSETPSPTALMKAADDSGPGNFEVIVTGLAPDTTYYLRAYAKNSRGIGYGLERNFKTKCCPEAPTVETHEVTAVTSSGVTCGGTVISDGGSPVTERGICWSESSPPTIDDNTFPDSLSGLGDFTSVISGLLQPDTRYYIKAYAINEAGPGYGAKRKFKTSGPNEIDPPTIMTDEVTDVKATQAVCGGNVTSDGGAEITERGICWSETSPPTISDSTVTDDSPGIGTFTGIMAGLAPDTTYYARAYAVNAEGSGYGLERNFTTPQVKVPTVETGELTGHTGESVTCGGTVVSDGGADIIERGICWSETSPPTISDNTDPDDSPGPGSFTGTITELVPDTTYYVRAYAVNVEGLGYGAEKSFTTSDIPGDIDCDQTVSLGDAILALKILAGIDPGPICKSDGKIGIEDTIYILKELVSQRN